jgi:hypothetical protein
VSKRITKTQKAPNATQQTTTAFAKPSDILKPGGRLLDHLALAIARWRFLALHLPYDSLRFPKPSADTEGMAGKPAGLSIFLIAFAARSIYNQV